MDLIALTLSLLLQVEPQVECAKSSIGVMVNEIESKELFERLKNEKFHLIDVREIDEFASHHVDGSILHPFSAFTPHNIQTELPIIFICRSGNRSGKAALLYLSHFPNATVYNLKGGLLAWNAASLPLIRNI